MDNEEKKNISEIILNAIQKIQCDSYQWIDLASIGNQLSSYNVNYKELGYLKLKDFLDEFNEILEFDFKIPGENKTPVYSVRSKSCYNNTSATKPPYENSKPALMALGFLKSQDKEKIVNNFSKRTDVKPSWEELNNIIKTSYENGYILYYEYDENGKPVRRDTFSQEKTVVFAINTNAKEYKEDIFALYNKNNLGRWTGVTFKTQKQIYKQVDTYKIGKLIFDNFASANNFIIDLHSKLLPGETWKYAKSAQLSMRKKTDFEILESYIRTVFAALAEEHDNPNSLNYGKIKFSQDKKYALFNTGLLDTHAMDIRVIGKVSSLPSITLREPSILMRGKSELSTKGFNAEDADVDMVSFFYNVSQIVYDATVEVDTSDIAKLQHCIDEGIKKNRFPKKCKEQYDNGRLEELTDNFVQAIRRAERIARRNYKYVVPQYRTAAEGHKIQFLMPIYMMQDYNRTPDFALVLSESKIGEQKFYKPETILELAWAYNNARVICKPDDTWLNPDRIEDVGDFDINE